MGGAAASQCVSSKIVGGCIVQGCFARKLTRPQSVASAPSSCVRCFDFARMPADTPWCSCGNLIPSARAVALSHVRGARRCIRPAKLAYR